MPAALLFAPILNAEENTLVMAHMAGWNVPTFHFLDVVHTSGRLVLPDIGYDDFGKSNYRELFGGGGGVRAFDLWLQRIPGNSLQFQLRYAGVFRRTPH